MGLGTVKWFNNQKGYGFICPIGTNDEVFAHFSSIQMDGYKTLKAGQSVSFELKDGPKGLHALNIQAPDQTQLPTSQTISENLSEDIREHDTVKT